MTENSHLKRKILPFSAIIGQDEMKLALLLNAVNPAIGGVLIRGEMGTAKVDGGAGACGPAPGNLVV